MKNKNLAAMQRAIILMEEAQKMYAKALEAMKSELLSATVDNVRVPKESITVEVAIESKELESPQEVIVLPDDVVKDIYGSDFDKDANHYEESDNKEHEIAKKLACIAGLGDIEGDLIIVGLKQFYNEGKEIPFLSKHHLDVKIGTIDDEGEVNIISSRYIRINQLDVDTEMYLRKHGAMNFKGFEPKEIGLML